MATGIGGSVAAKGGGSENKSKMIMLNPGDSVIDWRTARNASTAVCMARYGFGFEGFPLEDLRPDDQLVDAPMELGQLLRP